MPRKVTIKPDPQAVRGSGQYQVFVDGELIGEFVWSRWQVRTGPSRYEPKVQGRLFDLRNGKMFDLSNYAWLADVRRFVPSILGLDRPPLTAEQIAAAVRKDGIDCEVLNVYHLSNGGASVTIRRQMTWRKTGGWQYEAVSIDADGRRRSSIICE